MSRKRRTRWRRARSDDEEASITTNDVAAAGNANATETIRVQRGVVEDGGSKAVNDEANKCEVRQRRTRGCRSRCRTREGDKQKRVGSLGWYSLSASEEEDGGREASVEAPPGITVEPEGEEKEDGRRTDDLAARVQKLEEQVRGMHRKMWEAMGFAEATTAEENVSWRHDGAGGGMAKMEGCLVGQGGASELELQTKVADFERAMEADSAGTK